MLKPSLLAVAIALLATGDPAAAQSASRARVETIRPLLDRALVQGTAEGVLSGPATALIAKHFGTTAPIELTVIAEGPRDKAGCRPLAVTTAQDGVIDFNVEGRASEPRRQSFTWRAVYCGNGEFKQEVREGSTGTPR